MIRAYKAAITLFAADAVLSAPAGTSGSGRRRRCSALYPEKKKLNAEGGALTGTGERRLCRGDFS